MNKVTIYKREEYLAIVRKMTRLGVPVSTRRVTKLGIVVAWIVYYS